MPMTSRGAVGRNSGYCAGLFAVSSILASPAAFGAGTTKGGSQYVQECAQAGVPTPPTWNYEDAFHQVNGSQWKRAGVIENEFISAAETAEAFYFESQSPPGVCIALPRSVFPAGQTPEQGPPTYISLLGVICQGKQTGKACFWDQGEQYVAGGISPFTTLQFGDGPLASAFVGGAELVGPGNDNPGGVCSTCHRGENVFIIHPASPFGLIPNLMPNVWGEPLLPVGWPGNEGPTSLFAPSDTGTCLGCHRSGATGGRFPEVSNQTPAYCNILRTSFRKTMPLPPTGNEQAVNFPPYQTLDSACNAPPAPASNPAQKMMSFDPPPQQFWTAQSGTLSQVSNQLTEGTSSMAVNASGYVRLDSGSFSTWQLPIVGTRLDLDVYVPPAGQPQPTWLGGVDLFITIPSAQLTNTFVGHVELTPGGTGWRTAAFQLPSQVRTALLEPHAAVRLGVAVNRAGGAPAILLDNLRFGGSLSLPPMTPAAGLQYDFERGGTWRGKEGVVTQAANSGEQWFLGASSLRVTINGSSSGRVYTKPLSSPPAGATVSYRVFIPGGAPVTAVQPYVADKNWVWAQSYNANLPRNGWVTLTAVIPPNATLPVQEIGVKFYLSGPYSGPLYLDAVQW
ncbi:MAG: hypothetical protein EOO73_02220 [Myxococcales bacterium]|nr:MAG: hypothetical protein EOO73_02220 [Myxococcales bacterium]